MENIPPKYFSLPLLLCHAQRGCVDFYICKVKDIFRFLNVLATFLFINTVIIFRQEMRLRNKIVCENSRFLGSDMFNIVFFPHRICCLLVMHDNDTNSTCDGQSKLPLAFNRVTICEFDFNHV